MQPNKTADPRNVYVGLQAADRYGKSIELTPQGVRIRRCSGIGYRFDHCIPYADIRGVVLVRASVWGEGHMTLFTACSSAATARYMLDPSLLAAQMRDDDPFTLCFGRWEAGRIEPIFKALMKMQAQQNENEKAGTFR